MLISHTHPVHRVRLYCVKVARRKRASAYSHVLYCNCTVHSHSIREPCACTHSIREDLCPLLNTLRRDGSPSKLLRGPGGAFSSCGMELDWSVGWSMSVAPSFSVSEHWGSGPRACWPRACHTAHRASERGSITERTVNSHGGAWGASGAHLASRARGGVYSDRPGPVCRPRAGVLSVRVGVRCAFERRTSVAGGA